MNLTLLNYILPQPYPDLLIENIKSYGSDFWNNVDTNIIFKNGVSDSVIDTLKEFKINYSFEPNSFWLTTVTKLVEECKTNYFELFFEDKKMIDVNQFNYSFKMLEENNIDFMPTFHYNYMNALAELMLSYVPIESNDEFTLMWWGTRSSRFARNKRFNEYPELKNIIDTKSTPYPVLAAGVYKKEFFLKTAYRVMESEYWKIIQQDPMYFKNIDWAKNPYLPHSYEVWWKHNEDTEELNYTMLIPKKSNSIGNDPKDATRTSFKEEL